MDMSHTGMAYGEDVDCAEWIHVKGCALDVCKAISKLQDWSSLTK